MLLPQHIQLKRKNKFNYGLFFTVIILFILFGIGIWKWKQIAIFFSGNSKLKISKVEEKIFEQIKKGSLSKNLISEFQSVSNLYYEAVPTDPSSNFYLAKSYYYEFYSKLKFTLPEIIQFNSINASLSSFESILNNKNFELMYRIALRAEAFQSNFSEAEQNKVFINLYEIIEANRNKDDIIGELSLIDISKLPEDLQKLLFKMNLMILPKAGKVDELDILFQKNDSEKYLEITDREKSFFKAVSYYNKKEFVKSLEAFRNTKKDLDQITIEATRYEAQIFSEQNLQEKAISILETLYEETGSQNRTIIEQVKIILATKPNLKTKLNIE